MSRSNFSDSLLPLHTLICLKQNQGCQHPRFVPEVNLGKCITAELNSRGSVGLEIRHV
jgi:hypothetical protein